MPRAYPAPMLLALLLACRPQLPASAPEPLDAMEASTRADAAYRAGDWARCAEDYAMAAEGGFQPGRHYYNGACCAALDAQTERAYELLFQALEANPAKASLLLGDEDLASLRSHPIWPEALARAGQLEQAWHAEVNTELLQIYRADQADRRGTVDIEGVMTRDAERLARVKELVAEDALQAPDDFVHAAFVLQHGHDPQDYEMARDLALTAHELGARQDAALWLSAAAHDRYLQSIGQPQIYGTQFQRDGEGPWTLEPFDRQALTDAQRAARHVPPLAEAERRLEAMNARDTQSP